MKRNIYLSILLVFVLLVFSVKLKAQYVSIYDEKGNAKSIQAIRVEESLNNLKKYSIHAATNISSSAPRPLTIAQKTGSYLIDGFAKFKINDFAAAIEYYNKAIDLNPDFKEAYFFRAMARKITRNYTGAIEDYNKALEFSPRDEIYYCGRGEAKMEMQNNAGAMKDFNTAIEINKKYEEAYYNRGIAKKNLNDHSGALEDLNKAIELSPKFALAYMH
ncbi:MAG: tetratricopeptide repeat protein, partial [Ferruginibacter sp.]